MSTALALWANRERVRAANEQARAVRAEADAEEKAHQAETVSAFLVDAFRRPNPGMDGRDVRVVDLLDQAARNVEKEFAGAPKSRGDLMDALSRTYEGLGLSARAVEIHEAALKLRQAEAGPDHRDTLASMNELAKAYHAVGRRDDALRLYQETLKLARARFGPDHLDTLSIENNLARLLHRLDRFDEAMALFERAYQRRKAVLGNDHWQTLSSLHNLALVCQDAGQMAKALSLHEEAYQGFESRLGSRHPTTLSAANDLARVYRKMGQVDDSIGAPSGRGRRPARQGETSAGRPLHARFSEQSRRFLPATRKNERSAGAAARVYRTPEDFSETMICFCLEFRMSNWERTKAKRFPGTVNRNPGHFPTRHATKRKLNR